MWFCFKLILESGREERRVEKGERERLICCPTYLCIDSCMCPEQGLNLTYNLGVVGCRSNQLSDLARAESLLINIKQFSH